MKRRKDNGADPRQHDMFALWFDSEYDPKVAAAARDEAVNRVLDNNPEFRDVYADWIAAIPKGTICIGEDMTRLFKREHKGLRPKHHNAYGAGFGASVRRGEWEWLRELKPMKKKTSHARPSPLWRKI